MGLDQLICACRMSSKPGGIHMAGPYVKLKSLISTIFAASMRIGMIIICINTKMKRISRRNAFYHKRMIDVRRVGSELFDQSFWQLFIVRGLSRHSRMGIHQNRQPKGAARIQQSVDIIVLHRVARAGV
jgi:hypothetical protein